MSGKFTKKVYSWILAPSFLIKLPAAIAVPPVAIKSSTITILESLFKDVIMS